MNDLKEIIRRLLIVVSSIIGYGTAFFCFLILLFSNHKNDIDLYLGIFGLILLALTFASKKVIDWIFLKNDNYT